MKNDKIEIELNWIHLNAHHLFSQSMPSHRSIDRTWAKKICAEKKINKYDDDKKLVQFVTLIDE